MFRFGLVIAGLTVAFDQLTKWVMLVHVMDPPRTIPVTPFFNLVPVWNRGASFGMFGDSAAWMPWVLTGFAVIVAVGLAIWLRRVEGKWMAVALGLVIGGAVGNVIDRVRFGAVYDFLDFYAGAYHFPAFNAADSGITIGVAMILIDALIERRAGNRVSPG